ncbi:WXG100 family type VII secretion target [Lentzea flava]|uniref:WXG100 family type VII secretion target n=1 Tax=Lentzea flava TaxID=103732 RepID=A0ABQ2VAC0_9PSEU|nr:WXG100 family type VII secretion target [Lentzea flava]MCP2204347.1 WXG100 family type VII secretion target [Lentzea flava]GGU76780.1 hypothetical protein GCM10010178_80000 [Lentzea flava]
MAEPTTVNPGAVSTTAEGMHKAAGFLTETASTAKGALQSVGDGLAALKATWTGQASMAFDAAVQDWMSECKVIMDKLTEMIVIMQGNQKVIVSGEESNNQIAASIATGPGLSGL